MTAAPSSAATLGAQGTEPARSAAPVAEPSLPIVADITFDVLNGPAKAQYTLKGQLLACASSGDSWRIEAADAASAGLSEILLLIEPPSTGLARITLFATIGPAGTPAARYYLLRVKDTGGRGSGTVTVKDARRGATVRVEGRTDTGEDIRLVAQCDAVVRFPAGTPG